VPRHCENAPEHIAIELALRPRHESREAQFSDRHGEV
jgi:hypothetical protein